jgi:hypothetical protein
MDRYLDARTKRMTVCRVSRTLHFVDAKKDVVAATVMETLMGEAVAQKLGPTLPESANSSPKWDRSKKPKIPNRWLIPTTTACWLRARLSK